EALAREDSHTVTRITAWLPTIWLKPFPLGGVFTGRPNGGEDRGKLVMEAGVNENGKHGGFYPGYLPHDRSLIPVAVTVGAIVAMWLCLYFIAEEQNPQTALAGERAAAILVSRPVSH